MKNPLSFMFPQRCVVCGGVIPDGGFVCKNCEGSLIRVPEPRCAICGEPLPSEFAMEICAECRAGVPYEKCFSPFLYKDGARRAALRMKFHSHPAICRFFARELAAELGGLRPDFITFVPQNRKTHRIRGYNQTELIARELGRLMSVPVKSTLIRKEKGEKQVRLNQNERLKNAKKLYAPKKLRLSGVCLIVDDVMTTGSTMRACCGLLKKMGCERVYGATAARTEPIGH